jgi:hypothetical protein
MASRKAQLAGCFILLGGLVFFMAVGVGIFFLTNIWGKNISHGQDQTRFDPILARDVATEFAGPDVSFASMSASNVRSDGTQDFSNEEYPPLTTYTFVGKAKSAAPVGVIAHNTPGVTISVRRKGVHTTRPRAGQTNFHYHFGLSSQESSAMGLETWGFPTCSFKELWEKAIAKGAPKDAVASITYAGAYSFGILGTGYNFQFDQFCQLLTP